MIDAGVRSISPTGLALAILLASVACLTISVLAVGLRVYLRLADGVFGIDDALIVAGLVRDLPQLLFFFSSSSSNHVFPIFITDVQYYLPRPSTPSMFRLLAMVSPSGSVPGMPNSTRGCP